MSEDITKWLNSLGLVQYADAFDEGAIDWEVLPSLDHEILKELGVKAPGHRIKILNAIQMLSSESTAQASPSRIADGPATGEAERRQLTVMFCDLVDSTELSQRLDPEDLREINRAYQDACKAAIERYEGYVARYMGDGVLAYFGYPQAHEDDAERAIHAGLGVVESVASISNQDIELGVRVGIATGPVVVGDLIGEGASQESAVVGETPNLAARLQGLAARNSVVIGSGTYDLVREQFEYDELGEHPLKGIAEPVRARRVIGSITAESRFELTRSARLTPLVGREHEIALLLDRWTQAKEGDGQVILLSGEAGIGKSRITEALRERTNEDNPVRLRYQCSPFYTNTALHPVVDQLERAARFESDDTNEVRLDKLVAVIRGALPGNKEIAPLLAPLLSIPTGDKYVPLDMTPEQQKERTLEALVNQMEGMSRHRPVLLVFEDIHWADPTSLELLELTIERVQSMPALVVLTYRPEFSPPWSEYTHITLLALNRFSRSLASAMVGNVTGGKHLPAEVLEQIIEKTDGVPLFVEELTKTILESGQLQEMEDRYVATGTLQDVTIPATLHDSLMARLDRLGAVKEVAQTVAAIGREFDYDLLAVVSPFSFEKLRDALSQLTDAGLVFRRGRSEEGRYIFKHALVQDAAYGSLLTSKRQDLHHRIANALSDRFPERVESQPELLAHHYTEGGLLKPAVAYWMKAGHRALARSANHEAVGHLSAALDALLRQPPSTERDRQELDIQLASLHPLLNTTARGFASDEANEAAARARALCEQLGETEKLGGILWVEAMTHAGNGNHQGFSDVGAELIELGGRHANDMCVLCGLEGLGWSCLAMGDFPGCHEHSTRMLEIYDPTLHAIHLSFKPIDAKVTAMVQQGFAQWFMGFPDRSRACAEDVITHGRRLKHSASLAAALSFSAWAATLRHDITAAERIAQEILELPSDQRSPIELPWGQVFAGWAMGKRGDLDNGISMLRAGLDYLQQNFLWCVSTQLALLAELYIDDEKYVEAAEVLDEASEIVERRDERLWEAEISRLNAAVSLQTGQADPAAAEAHLQKAIGVARRQASKSLELRSSIALGKLWHAQSKRAEARELVAPVYDLFTEGFDTPDLMHAKTLLDELS